MMTSDFNFSTVPALVPNILGIKQLPTNRNRLANSPSIYSQPRPLAFPAQQHPTAPLCDVSPYGTTQP